MTLQLLLCCRAEWVVYCVCFYFVCMRGSVDVLTSVFLCTFDRPSVSFSFLLFDVHFLFLLSCVLARIVCLTHVTFCFVVFVLFALVAEIEVLQTQLRDFKAEAAQRERSLAAVVLVYLTFCFV